MPKKNLLTKRVDSKIITVAQVDCVVEQRLCSEQGVNSYPNIRLYPTGVSGYSRFDQYNGWMRDANSLLQWVSNYMPTISIILNMESFENLVLSNFKDEMKKNQLPWIVDFYAPWCGHCQVFAPTFEALASVRFLKDKLKKNLINF